MLMLPRRHVLPQLNRSASLSCAAKLVPLWLHSSSMRLLFLVLLVLACFSNVPTAAQISALDTSAVDWDRWEVPVSSSVQEEAITAISQKLENLYGRPTPSSSFREVLEASPELLHFVDFSGDGRSDVILNHFFGPENRRLVLFHRVPEGFEISFEGLGLLTAFHSTVEGAPLAYQIFKAGCCADPRHFYSTFVPVQAATGLSYEVSQRWMTFFHRRPSGTRLDRVLRFRTTQPQYHLRWAPEIDRERKMPGGQPVMGNVIATFGPNTFGTAMESVTDKTGRTWWLVKIPQAYVPITQPAIPHFKTYNFVARPALVGWMSARYLQKTGAAAYLE